MAEFKHERIRVGIITMADQVRGFRGNRRRFREWCVAGEARGFDVVVIPHSNLLARQAHILAFRYDYGRKRWVQEAVPRPLIYYNRIPSRQDEHTEEVRRLLQRLHNQKNVVLFNRRFFNKWVLMKWLQGSQLGRRHVPKSWRYHVGGKGLIVHLRKFKCLYFKPEQGRAGAGIMVARLERDGAVRWSKQPASTSAGVRVSRYPTADAWLSAVHRDVGAQRYVVQQGIDLARHHGRPFDLRLLLQKNRHGRWTVTGIGARVAGATSITTHVPRGGSIAEPAALLRATLGRAKSAALTRKLRQLAPRFARQIERASGDNLGELSLDVGVDGQGRLWLFEANAKPMTFDEPVIHERAIRTFFDYCRYLHTQLSKQRQ